MEKMEKMKRLGREALDNLVRIYLEKHCDMDLSDRDFCYHISDNEGDVMIKVSLSFSDAEWAPEMIVIPFKTLIHILDQALVRLARGNIMYYGRIKPIGYEN